MTPITGSQEIGAHQLNIYGLKIGLLPALLIYIFLAVMISIIVNETEPSWDFTLQNGIYLSILVFSTFMILTTFGISRISSYLASPERRISDISSIFLGLSIGTILVIIGQLLFIDTSIMPGDTIILLVRRIGATLERAPERRRAAERELTRKNKWIERSEWSKRRGD
jgi:hypothetical protein